MSVEPALKKNALESAGGVQLLVHESVGASSDGRRTIEELEISWKSGKYGKAVPFRGLFIDSDTTDSDASILDRVRALAEYASQHPDSPVSVRLFELFPDEVVSEGHVRPAPMTKPEFLAPPEVAPALWQKDKLSGDTPPTFILRHYEPWLGKGLTRPVIKKLDPQLYVALSNWLRTNSMPDTLDLPTLKEANDRWVARVRADPRSALPTDPGELLRLGHALRYRQP